MQAVPSGIIGIPAWSWVRFRPTIQISGRNTAANPICTIGVIARIGYGLSREGGGRIRISLLVSTSVQWIGEASYYCKDESIPHTFLGGKGYGIAELVDGQHSVPGRCCIHQLWSTSMWLKVMVGLRNT